MTPLKRVPGPFPQLPITMRLISLALIVIKFITSVTVAKQKLEILIVLKWQRRSNNAEILFSKLTSKPSSLKKREKV